MKTILSVLGALVIVVVIYFIGVSHGWWKNIFKKATPDNAPNACDPTRKGYRKDGVKDSYCGQVPCDPNKIGYDMDGLPDINCGFFGRQGLVPTQNADTGRQGWLPKPVEPFKPTIK